MTRQNIVLGDYTYIVDLYRVGEDGYIAPEKKFTMIKESNVMNTIVYDNSVMFIEESIIADCVDDENMVDMNKLKEKIVFPLQNINGIGFTTNISKFESDIIESNIMLGREVLPLYKFNYNNEILDSDNYANIKCDKLRIHLPATNPNLDAIICVSNYINNVHFYYICEYIKNYDINVGEEYNVNNTHYFEYYDVYIPSINELFKTNSIYTIENCNINEIQNHLEFKHGDDLLDIYTNITCKESENGLNNGLNLRIKSNKNTSISIDGELYYINNTYIQILKDDLAKNNLTINDVIANIKYYNTFTDVAFNITEKNNLYNCNICYISDKIIQKIILGDYENIITVNPYIKGFYLETSNIDFATNDDYIVFYAYGTTKLVNAKWLKYNDYTNIISLQSLIKPFAIEKYRSDFGVGYKKVFIDEILPSQNFTNGNITVLLYPYSELNTTTELFIENNSLLPNSDTFVLSNEIKINANFSFNENEFVVKTIFEHPDNHKTIWDDYSNIFGVNYYSYLNFEQEDDEDEYVEEFENTSINVVGYRIEIATDNNFKSLVYEHEANIALEDISNIQLIDDFEFSLNNIFSSWNEMPEMLVVRTIFIDKVTSNTIYSNNLLITKEHYKYIINEGNNKLIALQSLQADPNKKNTGIMDLSQFNFIDKITCTVNKTEINNDVNTKSANMPKILYKPIFYRVSELQKIRIRRNVKQNIGINLSEIMTKVETFKLLIDGIQYIEYARNDVYVLFNVDASKLTNKGGLYTMSNQDDEYLTEGEWVLY